MHSVAVQSFNPQRLHISLCTQLHCHYPPDNLICEAVFPDYIRRRQNMLKGSAGKELADAVSKALVLIQNDTGRIEFAGGNMAKLKDRVQTALQEGRILILGAQVLLGFQYRSIFEKGFEQLPEHAQYLKLCGLGLMIVAVGLLMLPGAYHRIVEEGEDTEHFHNFVSRVLGVALLPFALGLGLDFFVAGEKLASSTVGIVSGVAATLMALFFWYGWEAIRKPSREPRIEEKKDMEESNEQDSEQGGSKMKDKIKHLLTEARTVLPGAQALLGFQFATMLVEGFDKLPMSSKYVHFASLSLVAITIVLLMTPAAYHRIVEEGEETRHFHRTASRLLLVAMIPLALGIAGDLFVVARKVTESAAFAVAVAAAALLFFYGLWFGFTFYRRRQSVQSKNWEMDFAER
jgi:hypothetical protein